MDGVVVGVLGGVVVQGELFESQGKEAQILLEYLLVVSEGLTDVTGEVLWTVPMEDMYERTMVSEVNTDVDLGRGKMEEGVNGEVNDADGMSVIRKSPLKEMVGSNQEGGEDMPGVYRREGAVVGDV